MEQAIAPPKRPVMERLFERREINEQGCWLWTGYHTLRPDGTVKYGQMWVNGRWRTVHRLSASLFLGLDLDSVIQVNHRCDVPLCFNPEHLFLGDQSDNINDAISKGRFIPYNNPRELSAAQREEIRIAKAAGAHADDLAKHYGVTVSTVCKIAPGRVSKYRSRIA